MLAAPCDEKTGKSKELSVALANRSAVLFSLKAFHLALDDIKLAMEVGYPEELQFKVGGTFPTKHIPTGHFPTKKLHTGYFHTRSFLTKKTPTGHFHTGTAPTD